MSESETMEQFLIKLKEEIKKQAAQADNMLTEILHAIFYMLQQKVKIYFVSYVTQVVLTLNQQRAYGQVLFLDILLNKKKGDQSVVGEEEGHQVYIVCDFNSEIREVLIFLKEFFRTTPNIYNTCVWMESLITQTHTPSCGM